MRPRRRTWLLLMGWLCTVAGCMELSPFASALEAHERGSTRENMARLAAQPSPSARWSFAVLADSHQDFDALAAVVERMNAVEDLELVVHLGDFSAVGLRRDYQLTLAQLRKLRVPFFTAIGNHDTLSNGKQLYREMFGATDYVFRHGPARFVVFNSNTLEYGPHVPDREWLTGATALASSEELIIALTHQPAPPTPYLDVLVEGAVTAAISAHDHTFRIGWIEGLLTVSAAHAEQERWILLHVEGRKLRVDDCSRHGCVARSP